MTEPTKKEMLECFDNCDACSLCPYRYTPKCDEIEGTIRALIESAPEPGTTSPSGPMTDEEAFRILEDAMEEAYPKNYRECEKAVSYLRTRLAQKPTVTREQVRRLEGHLMPGMDFATPGNKQETQVILSILGLEVEEKS